MNLFKFFKRKKSIEEILEKPAIETEVLEKNGVVKFNHRVRKDSEKMTDKEKMDQGFNGSTYSINGRDIDF